MPTLHHGAHQASRRRLAAVALAALAVLAIAPASFAATPESATQADSTLSTAATTLTPEVYYLRLINCTRTGGWVQSNGSCSGYGSGHYSAYVAPIRSSLPLRVYVAKPYAKLLAVRGKCAHDLDGDPGYRMRRAGFTPSWWGENIGCRDGSTNVYAAILASHRAMQAEKSYNGGHWKNIKNRMYVHVGIGIYRYGSRIRVVTDFYRPG